MKSMARDQIDLAVRTRAHLWDHLVGKLFADLTTRPSPLRAHLRKDAPDGSVRFESTVEFDMYIWQLLSDVVEPLIHAYLDLAFEAPDQTVVLGPWPEQPV